MKVTICGRKAPTIDDLTPYSFFQMGSKICMALNESRDTEEGFEYLVYRFSNGETIWLREGTIIEPIDDSRLELLVH